MTNQAHIAITGASGFIGTEMLHYFLNRNYKVTAYVRVIPKEQLKNVIYVAFNLLDEKIGGIPDDLNEFLHLAYVSHDENANSETINLNFCKWLKAESEKRKFRVTYVSSFSAHENALSYYGKSKLACEKLFDLNSSLVLKPGLVIGNGGLFARIKKEVLKSKFIFLPDGGQQKLQIIDVHDLCRVVEEGIVHKTAGLFWLAHPEVITLKDIEMQIAQSKGKTPRFINVPLGFILGISKMVNLLGIKLSISVESILGLKSLRTFDTNESIQKLNIQPLSFKEALNKYHE